MTEGVTLSPGAEADLAEVWDNTQNRWGVGQAEAYVRQLWAHIRMLVTHPELGVSCPEIRDGYHKSRSGAHILFYRRTNHGIDIVRILHKRMDCALHFDG
jgi:toxin ParE1/3/4